MKVLMSKWMNSNQVGKELRKSLLTYLKQIWSVMSGAIFMKLGIKSSKWLSLLDRKGFKVHYNSKSLSIQPGNHVLD